MCLLTLAALENRKNSILFGMLVSRLGSEKHDDGTGIMTTDSTWKTELKANSIINLGALLAKHITPTLSELDPVAFHVRSATFGIPIIQENAHPFVGKHFTLMHNGTLESDVPKSAKSSKTDSDSLAFLVKMDEIAEKDKKLSFVDLLNKTMEHFTGKFAFIIKENKTNKFYVIRGKTAELWVSFAYALKEGEDYASVKEANKTKRKPLGYVVHTNKDNLLNGINEYVNIHDFIYPTKRVGFSTPELLEQETAFLVTLSGLEKLGEVKERAIERQAQVVAQSSPVTRPTNSVSKGGGNGKEDTLLALIYARRINEWLDKFSLSIEDFQIIFGLVSGTSLLELTKEDVDFFFNSIVPVVNCEKRLAARVKEALRGRVFPDYLYDKFSLEFPWTVNEPKQINEVIEHLKTLPG